MIYRRGVKASFLSVALCGLVSAGTYAADMVHVVAKGETIYSISRSYKVSQDELMRRNNLADASKLQAGMKLTIPGSAVTVITGTAGAPANSPAGYTEYVVSKNDTLYSIARVRGITLQALCDTNGFSRDYVIKIGEKIKIPAPAMGQPSPITEGPTPLVAPQAVTSVTTIQKEPPRAELKKANASLRWPVTTKEVLYMNNNHGVLVSGQKSESVKSMTGGTVVYASPWRGYGNVAVVEADGGYRYIYGACDTLSVRKGDIIEPGAELGKLGIYPASGRAELVLIVSQNGTPVDPAKAPRFN